MAQDVVITPASGKMEFFQTVGGSAVANIQLNSSTSDLSFQTTSGNLIIGDASRDVYIGDGINSVDVVFEQNGEIRALTNKTLTLGQSDSIVNFNTSKTTFSAGNVGVRTTSPDTNLHIVSSSAISSASLLKIDGGAVGFNGSNDANTAFSLIFNGCAYKASTGIVQKTGAEIQMLKYGSWNEAAGGVGTKASLVFKTNNGTIDSQDLTERMRIQYDGNVGIGTSSPAYKLDVNGTIHYTSLTASSDARFKTNVQPIENALEKINNVRGVRFEWNEFVNNRRNGYELNKPTFGVLAQELEVEFPELVTTWQLSEDCPDARSVNYEKIIPVLIEAIKELKTKNEILENRITILENQ